MTTWKPDQLSRIGSAEELQLSSNQPDGTTSRYTTMWVVRAGDELYVRSAYGADSPWYVRAKAAGTGRIRAGGVERNVVFAEAAADQHPAIDDAYHAKYDHYGERIVNSVVGQHARAVTIRLVPADADDTTPQQ